MFTTCELLTNGKIDISNYTEDEEHSDGSGQTDRMASNDQHADAKQSHSAITPENPSRHCKWRDHSCYTEDEQKICYVRADDVAKGQPRRASQGCLYTRRQFRHGCSHADNRQADEHR